MTASKLEDSKKRIYKQTFFWKGFAIAFSPLIVNSICLLAVAAAWLASSDFAQDAEKRTHSILLVDRAFASLVGRGYKKFGYAFQEERMGQMLANKQPSAQITTKDEPDDVKALALACEKLEFEVDKRAQSMLNEVFNNQAQRLVSYGGILRRTIKTASEIDGWLENKRQTSHKLWSDWARLRAALYILTFLAFMISAGVAGLACLYFSYDIARRIRALEERAISLSKLEPHSQPLSGDDEVAFLETTFAEVADKLTLAARERAMLIRLVSDNILAPAQEARAFFQKLVQEPELAPSLKAKTVRDWQEVIDIAFIKISRFAGDLLLVGNPTEEQAVLDLTYFSIKDLAQRCILELAPIVRRKSITLKNQCGDLYVMADMEKISRILVNLVSNAVKFSPAGSCIEIAAAADASGDLTVKVLDRGPGLSEEEGRKIFERFVQTDTAQKSKGFGLGLSICQNLVSAHGGKIGVKPREGGGSEFWFSLPATTEIFKEEESKAAASASKQTIKETLLHSRILRKALLLLLIPLLSQTIALGWIYNRMGEAYQLLDSVKREEELAMDTSSIWINIFNAGYSTAIYFGMQKSDYETLARRSIKQTLAIIPRVQPVNSDSAEERYTLKAICLAADQECTTLSRSLDNPEMLGADGLISSLGMSLNRAATLTARLTEALEHQYDSLSTLVAQQQEKQRLVQYTLLAALFSNVLLALLLAGLFKRVFGRRIETLVETAKKIPLRLPIDSPPVITDEIDQLLELLARGATQLDLADDKREEFISALAHDIRSPLQSIKIILDMSTRESLVKEELKLNAALVELGSALDTTIDLVEDLLTLNKLKYSKPEKDVQSLSVSETIADAVAEIADLAGGKDVFVDFEDELTDLKLDVDEGDFHKLLFKLLKVAVQNAPEHTTIKLNAWQENKSFFLHLEDNGPSLAKDISVPIALEKAINSGKIEQALSLAVCEQLCLTNGLSLRLIDATHNEIEVVSA